MTVDPFSLVLHIDIFILALATVFALSTLPRAFARFSSAAEWRHGHILRSIRLGTARFRGPQPQITYLHGSKDPSPSNEKDLSPQVAGQPSSLGHEPEHVRDGVMMSEESHTYVAHTHLIRHASTRTLGSVSNLPPHFRAWSAILPPVGGFLRHRLNAGFSVGQALILGLYAAVLVYASFLKSNPFEDPVRMGIVAMSQIPIVYVLGTKNNIVGMCLGMGYEKVSLNPLAGSLFSCSVRASVQILMHPFAEFE